ncbi:disulfide bond formation protein B [Neisseriaceae bacterium B1]
MAIVSKFQSLSPFRQGLLLTLILGWGGVASSLFAQYVLGMNPCVMCIQQRMALLGIALMSLLVWWLPENKIMRWVSAVLVAAPAAFGLYIASQQIYLQSLPLMEQPSCGAPWTFRLRNAPLFDLYEWFIRGTGACGEVYEVLGVALPVWSALFFSLVLLILLVSLWRARYR